ILQDHHRPPSLVFVNRVNILVPADVLREQRLHRAQRVKHAPLQRVRRAIVVLAVIQVFTEDRMATDVVRPWRWTSNIMNTGPSQETFPCHVVNDVSLPPSSKPSSSWN